MARLFGAQPDNDLPPVPNYNVCPTNPVHTVWRDLPGRRLSAMRWGFVPRWYRSIDDGPLIINARAETVAEKPAFRDAVRRRRCLIPASGFYEWQKGPDGRRLPWYFSPPRQGQILALGGIWETWHDRERGEDSDADGSGGQAVRSCAIITTPANRLVARVHDRMPLIIARPDWPLWLGEAGRGAARLMRPAPDDALVAWRVSTRVNSSRAQGPELIEPIAPDGEAEASP